MKKYNFTGLTHDCGKEFNALAAFNKPMTTEIDGRVTTGVCRVAVGHGRSTLALGCEATTK